MDPGIIIGALALFTIGSTLVVAIFHFAFFLREPASLEAAKVVAHDRESATTRHSSNQGEARKPLVQRLNEAMAVKGDGL